MAELTGIPTEGFFRSTASVHHFELSDLSRDEGALRDRLQASISGADRGTSRARKKLDKALHDLGTRGDRNPGRLKVAEKAVEDARAAVDQGEMALAQLERDRDALSSAHDRRTDAETALAERRSMLEKARQAERVDRGTRRRRGALRALPPGRRRRRRGGRPGGQPSDAAPAPRPQDRRRTPPRRSTAGSASCGRPCRARSRSRSTSRRSRPGGPSHVSPWRWSRSGSCWPAVPWSSSSSGSPSSASPSRRSARSSRSSASSSPRSPCGSAAA